MIELQLFEQQAERIVESLAKRGISDGEARVEHVRELNRKRKELQTSYDQRKADANRISKEIGAKYREGAADEAEALKQEVSGMKKKLQDLEEEQKTVAEQLETARFELPNVLHELVPHGQSEADNEEIQPWKGDPAQLESREEAHWDLGESYGLIDMGLGAKISGSGFPVLVGKAAKLQRALISFFLDRATDAGYTEYVPPLLVNADSARGTGQLPDKEGQMYEVPADGLFLIPTAEVPLTNIYRDVIVDADELPLKLTGYTPCFRREAGSYGSEVKGLNRVHQFDKVEIVRVEKPENSYAALDEMMQHVSQLLEDLELPYRVLRLCGGDTGFAAAMTYDFEVYAAGQDRWLEVSSVSNFETFQAERLKLRIRAEGGNVLAHTLNGSALALARIIACILENGQTEAGIRIPKKLIPYTGFELIER
jgi:seryl-tRNA synthetase